MSRIGKATSHEYFHHSSKAWTRLVEISALLRQNHAMEHATINLLIKQLDKRVHVLGHTAIGGFYIYGDVPTGMVEKSAREALRRLREGSAELAISPMCGTNLAVAGLAAGVASLIAGKDCSGWNKFGRVVQASVLAVVIAQPLGRMAQRYLTTDADQDNADSVMVTRQKIGSITRHRVKVLRSY